LLIYNSWFNLLRHNATELKFMLEYFLIKFYASCRFLFYFIKNI
jgi:hypothetical protein